MKTYSLLSTLSFRKVSDLLQSTFNYFIIPLLFIGCNAFGQQHYNFDKMSEDELVSYMMYCQERPKVQYFHILNDKLKLGIFGPNEAVLLDERNLIRDTIDIGHPNFKHLVPNVFTKFYHLTDSTGFGLNHNWMTFLKWKGYNMVIEKTVSVLNFVDFIEPKAKNSTSLIVHDGFKFGYTMKKAENGSKTPKESPNFYFADKEKVYPINLNPKVLNESIYNTSQSMNSWFHNVAFIIDDKVFVNAEMENRCYIVDTKTKEVRFFTLPNEGGAWRVTYDHFQKKFYAINRTKKHYEIRSLSNDFSKLSSLLITVDQEPLKILNENVLIKYQSKKKDSPCHFLIPLYKEPFN